MPRLAQQRRLGNAVRSIRFAALAVATLTVAGAATKARAENYGFNAATGDWSDAASWVDSAGNIGVPPNTTSDQAYIGTTSSPHPSAAATSAVDVTDARQVFNVLLGNDAGTDGTLNLNAGGSIEFQNMFVGLSGTGTLNFTGGTVVSGVSYWPILQVGHSGTGTINLNGSTLDIGYGTVTI